ncbi:hypothetical protein Agabi119p4_4999 [Agaricus bisporus var. burnettii]|uniref:40S ribosomal protein S12 n=1 Tax=Agaricus bisporus var. burnettii TaxID=192524 RepID=A0A8H7F4D0_AGABI|nr:hypothetical protein Agabi119p4_4999 [Agaricus bisporus var. burnettii]
MLADNAERSLYLLLYAIRLTSLAVIFTKITQKDVSTEAPKGKLTVEEALQQVLKNALVHDGLARGLRECAKALDKRQAHLCVLVETCTEAEYIKLIEALCAEHKINLIKVGDAKVLGTWAGLCKIDREGNPRKIVGCTCVVVKDYEPLS